MNDDYDDPPDWDACPLCGDSYTDWHARDCMNRFKERLEKGYSGAFSNGMFLGFLLASGLMLFGILWVGASNP